MIEEIPNQTEGQPEPKSTGGTGGGVVLNETPLKDQLLNILGETLSRRLTAFKAADICQKQKEENWQISGFVLQCPGQHQRAIVEMGAVRWLTNEEMWWLMHDSAQFDRQLLPKL